MIQPSDRASTTSQISTLVQVSIRAHLGTQASTDVNNIELIRCCKAISYGRHFEESSRRAECDGAVQDACLDARSIELQNWYEHMIGNFATGYDRRMLPNRWDGGSMFGMRVWENEGRVPIDEAMFYGFVGDSMPALLQENIQNMMYQLAALVFWEYDWSLVSDTRLNLMDVNVGHAATLALPDALFVCKECGARGLPWPEIHGHWRERHPEQSFWRKKWVGMLGEQPKAQLWEAGREVAGTILDKLGLWIGMERVELDALVRIGRLYCACGDPEPALPEDLTWAGLVSVLLQTRVTANLTTSTECSSTECSCVGASRVDTSGDVSCA